ncbi:MAG: M56 family metallopeptidase [Eubacteriales bacterium]
MRQARFRKAVWLILLVELILFHFGVLFRLYVLRWEHPEVRYLKQLLPVWAAGAGVLSLWQLLAYQGFRRKALQAVEPVEESWIHSACEQAAGEAGLKRVPSLYQSAAVTTPMILGFLSPAMLIPDTRYSFGELRMVFLHECTHAKKRDLWYKLIFTVGSCLFWFQPAVWFLKNAAFKDVEVACDQSVTAGKSEVEREAYAKLLLDSLRQGRERSKAYSAYFYNSKSVMRARLQVVTREENPGFVAGAAAFLLLAAELALSVGVLGGAVRQDVREEAYRQEAAVNLYLGYEVPDSFSDTAAAAMAELTPVDGESYYEWRMNAMEQYPETEFADMTEAVSGPWQLRVKTRASYLDTVSDFVYRYRMYYEDPERGSAYNPEESSGYNTLEIIDRTLLAGDADEYVCRLLFRDIVWADETVETGLPVDGGRYVENGTEYRYFDWAVHVKRVGKFTYELVGVAETQQALAALEAAHPEDAKAAFASLPMLDLKQQDGCRARTQDGVLQATWDNGANWRDVPISLEKLTSRGDEMDGQLSGPQEKSYVVTDEVTAFAYGGSPTVPVSVTFSHDEGKNWKTIVVSNMDTSVRRLFLSFPDAEHGFLIFTGDSDHAPGGQHALCDKGRR